MLTCEFCDGLSTLALWSTIIGYTFVKWPLSCYFMRLCILKDKTFETGLLAYESCKFDGWWGQVCGNCLGHLLNERCLKGDIIKWECWMMFCWIKNISRHYIAEWDIFWKRLYWRHCSERCRRDTLMSLTWVNETWLNEISLKTQLNEIL